MANDWLKKLLWSLVISIIAIFVLVVSLDGLQKGSTLEIKNEKKINLGKCDFKVTEAVTAEEQTRGLMGIKNLPSDRAMIFPFDKSNRQTFWMKNMLIPIDLIWLNDKKVIGLVEKMLPDNGERVYQSPAPANLVVEAAAGAVKRCEIEMGIEILNSKF